MPSVNVILFVSEVESRRTEFMVQETEMRTVAVFRNGKNQAVRLPKDMEFDGVSELEIIKEGDTIILRPLKPNWVSFAKLDSADRDFLLERSNVIADEGRFEW